MAKRNFFGEQGLTSTSANHYANLAKEARRKMENYLNDVRFYDTSIKVIDQSDSTLVRKGNDKFDLELVKNMLREIANLNSLIAFFREAIKEKERLAKEAMNYEDTEGRAALNAQCQKLESERPQRGEYLSELDILEGWTIGEQEKYLSLEAEAAVLGKYIHEDGSISAARIDLMKRITNPVSLTGSGRDTIIYQFVPTIDTSDVDEMFFSLQKKHREVQAELNGMKKRIEDALQENVLKVDEEYRKALIEWSRNKSVLDDAKKLLSERESSTRLEKTKEVQALKIVVPNRLKPTLDELAQLG